MTIEASKDIVDAILNNDQEAFNSAFEVAMFSKIADALEIKKVEVASNYIDAVTPAVEDSESIKTAETETIETTTEE